GGVCCGGGRGPPATPPGARPMFAAAGALGPEPPLAELPPGCPLIEALAGCGTLTVGPRGAADAAGRQLQFIGGGAAQALVHEGQLLGLLVLGPREDSLYTGEDYN